MTAKTRVAINGLGRIGRYVARLIATRNDIELVAFNDLMDTDLLSYLLRHDSTHGLFKGDVSFHEESKTISMNHQKIHIFQERDPSNLPWKKLNVDLVLECTGLFTDTEKASAHIKAGAKKVIISAPAKDETKTLVMGVNHESYDPKIHHVVSNASCTTNCLAPVVKVLVDNFGIKQGLMSTIHAVTATQPTVDGPSKKDWRGGRSAMQNIIPASTGAAKAVALCIPEVKGKLTGMSFRVPVACVSCVDLTVELEKKTSSAEIIDAFQQASQSHLKNILHVTTEDVVSSDFLGSSFSSIVDVKAQMELNSQFFKIVAWYDNEAGYSHRLVDLALFISQKIN